MIDWCLPASTQQYLSRVSASVRLSSQTILLIRRVISIRCLRFFANPEPCEPRQPAAHCENAPRSRRCRDPRATTRTWGCCDLLKSRTRPSLAVIRSVPQVGPRLIDSRFGQACAAPAQFRMVYCLPRSEKKLQHSDAFVTLLEHLGRREHHALTQIRLTAEAAFS